MDWQSVVTFLADDGDVEVVGSEALDLSQFDFEPLSLGQFDELEPLWC
jgi:hypothetical protein